MPCGVRAAGPEEDLTVARHWRELGLEVGGPEVLLRPDSQESTLRFIADARDRLRHQTFVAVDSAGMVVGSASCRQWDGPFPMIAASPFMDLGTVWCVFVNPKHPRQGLGTRLIASRVEHWSALGCTRGILMYASELGRRLYVEAGFAPGNLLESVRRDAPPQMEQRTTCRPPSITS